MSINKETIRKINKLSFIKLILIFFATFLLFGEILAYKEWWEDAKVTIYFLLFGF